MKVQITDNLDPRVQLHSMRRLFPEQSLSSVKNKIQSLNEKGLIHLHNDDSWFAGYRNVPWDSSFFGMAIGRIEYLGRGSEDSGLGSLPEAKNFIKQLKESALKAKINYLTVQIDSGDALLLASLQSENFIVVDTIICYLLDLKSVVLFPSPLVRPAVADDSAAVAAIAKTCFSSPKLNANRFNSDPVFPSDKIGEMYSMWGKKSISGELANQVFVYDDGIELSGFITLSFPDPFDTAAGLNLGRIPLNAVSPAHHGKGIYGALVQGALLEMQNRGIDWVDIRTQLANVAVHRTWQKLGAFPSLSYYTLRYNAH